MLRSEMLSWPVTMIILVIAFGSLLAAGLPLMLTMVASLVAAGALVLSTHLAAVSIWALNFALMFALGSRDRLRTVPRRAFSGRTTAARGPTSRWCRRCRGCGRDGGHRGQGRRLQRPHGTRIPGRHSARAEPCVSLHGSRHHAVGGRRLSCHVDAAPAVLGRLGTRINAGRVRTPWRSGTKTRPGLDDRLHAWGRLSWRHPVPAGLAALGVLFLAAAPVIGLRTNCRRSPSCRPLPMPESVTTRSQRPSGPALRAPCRSSSRRVLKAPRSLPLLTWPVSPRSTGGDPGRVDSRPGRAHHRPLDATTGSTIDRMRLVLPRAAWSAGRRRKTTTSSRLSSRTPTGIGLLAVIGFILLLIALGAPLIAAAGVLITALSVAGAFGWRG